MQIVSGRVYLSELPLRYNKDVVGKKARPYKKNVFSVSLLSLREDLLQYLLSDWEDFSQHSDRNLHEHPGSVHQQSNQSSRHCQSLNLDMRISRMVKLNAGQLQWMNQRWRVFCDTPQSWWIEAEDSACNAILTALALARLIFEFLVNLIMLSRTRTIDLRVRYGDNICYKGRCEDKWGVISQKAYKYIVPFAGGKKKNLTWLCLRQNEFFGPDVPLSAPSANSTLLST